MLQSELLVPIVYGFLVVCLLSIYVLFDWVKFNTGATLIACVIGTLSGSFVFQYSWAPIPFIVLVTLWFWATQNGKAPIYILQPWRNPPYYFGVGLMVSLLKIHVAPSKIWILTFFLLILIVFLMGQLCLAMERKGV